MIATLHGVLEERGPDWVVVNVGGVGYKAYAPTSTLSALGATGDEVRLHTHMQVSQDNIALYGFATRAELGLFALLQTVQGVGPRLALALLSSLSPDTLVAAISSGDEPTLQRVSGVGKKTAARLVLELRDKVNKEWGGVGATPAAAPDGDALAALVALGYTPAEARHALAQAQAGAAANLPLDERVRRALQTLGRR